MDNDVLVFYGDEIKALGNGKVGGYLIRFSDANTPDLTGDFFTADTYLGKSTELDVFYNHGLDDVIKRRAIGAGVTKKDDVGVWIEAQLNMRDEYEKAVYDLAEKGKLGWSSGSAGHLVERKPVGKSFQITQWPVIEASLTPTPAEPRNDAISIKSLNSSVELNEALQEDVKASVSASKDDTDLNININISVGDNQMSENEQKAVEQPAPEAPQPIDMKALASEVKTAIQDVAKAEIEEAMKKAPRQSAGYYQVSAPKLSLADFIKAAKEGNLEAVANSIKTQTEGVGENGGFLLQEQYIESNLPELVLASRVAQLVNTINVIAPTGSTTMLDYTDTSFTNGDSADQAYGSSAKRAEGGAYSAQTIKFDKRQWTLTDAISGIYQASREIMNDYPQLAQVLSRVINRTFNNGKEYFTLRGSGAGFPEGVLNWAGSVNVTEATDNTISLADTTAMVSRLYNNPINPVWLVHPLAYEDLMTLELPNGGAAVTPDLTLPGTMRLWGYEIIKSQMLPAQGTDGYFMLVDLGAYNWYQQAPYIDYSREYGFANGLESWRFGQRVDGHMVYRDKITLNDGTSAVSPVVKLLNKV